jgi:hypothetical protein
MATVKKKAMKASETMARRLEKNLDATRRSGLSGCRVFAGSGASAVAVIGSPTYFAFANSSATYGQLTVSHQARA